jgi:Protein of unknown function (DUF4236)
LPCCSGWNRLCARLYQVQDYGVPANRITSSPDCFAYPSQEHSMGLYLRKSFRAGPFRINLSKSGLGLSAGVKGARFGVGPRGTYVHAGRGGLYYRKYLSSSQSRSHSSAQGDGCATLLLIVIAIGIGGWLLTWLVDNPAVLVAGVAVAISFPVGRWLIRYRRNKLLTTYKQALDSAFVTAPSLPPAAALSALKQRQQHLPDDIVSYKVVQKIEADIYQAVLDRVLDDGFVSSEEADVIAACEQTISISPSIRLQTKKDIFSTAYLEAIGDREITREELNKLTNLMKGLGIPLAEVQHELDIVREIISTQALRLPLKPVPSEELAAPIQKSESAFYQCSAQVLSKRKSADSLTGYEYSVRREGMMILTNKRVFVVGDGTTNIRFSDIGDVDVDIDEGIVEITKVASERPIILKIEAPIYAGRAIDLLVNAEAGGDPS